MLINSLLPASLCTWRNSLTVTSVSITWQKILLLILVICVSVLTEMIITYLTMSIDFSIFSFFPQLKSSMCFGPVIMQCHKDCDSCRIINPWNVPSKSQLVCFRILSVIILAAWKIVLKLSYELSKLLTAAVQMLDEQSVVGFLLNVD